MTCMGQRIKRLRLDKKMSRAQLANNICSLEKLQQFEADELIPNVVEMFQLCQRLDITLDQLMSEEWQTISLDNQWLDLLNYYYQTKRYQDLAKLLEQPYVKQQFKTLIEKQRLLYLEANCTYQLEQDFRKAKQQLKKALHLTYEHQKRFVTDMEILLLSDIGKLYAELEEYETSLLFFKKSIALFYQMPTERYEVELTKIFYNYASVLVSLDEREKALILISQGINWARKRNNYYYLDDLFLLKGIILLDLEQEEEASKYLDLAQDLQVIAYDKTLQANAF